MDSFDSSDILGQRTMPGGMATANASTKTSSSSSFSITAKAVALVLFLSSTYVLGRRFWKGMLRWKERSYKLATRRRHGIPDDDLRPFNVAYTDAVMRAKEEELKRQVKPPIRPPLAPLPHTPAGAGRMAGASSVMHGEAVTGHAGYYNQHTLRQRSVGDPSARSTTAPLPGGYSSRYTESHVSAAAATGGIPSQSQSDDQKATRPSRKRVVRRPGYVPKDKSGTDEARKRAWYLDHDQREDDQAEEDEHEAKKTRVEGEELIDGDEDAEFDVRVRGLGVGRVGVKRGIADDDDGAEDDHDDEGTETRTVMTRRGKRARKVSSERVVDLSMDVDVDVDVDEAMDDVAELKPLRGKKRDRAEAGSSFGAEDDDEEVRAENEAAVEQEDDEVDSKLRRRRRKRRTVAKRKSDAKKRDRQDEDGSEESSPSSRKVRSRRHDRPSLSREKSDISMDESVTFSSKRPREIGEEWESNGVRYKIGPNGQRMRQALVKKARQKFLMPKDSQHPDREANMRVCVECWLTEEEYKQAKKDSLLAWQDDEPKDEKLSLDISQQGVPFPPSIPGKNLLWSASASTTPTISPASYSPSDSGHELPMPRRAGHPSYRHSIATTVGLPIAFPGNNGSSASTLTMTAVKRISSASRALSLTGSSSFNNTFSSSGGVSTPESPGLSDSTNVSVGSGRSPAPPTKIFSKWEKQELEARAIMKVREANRKKEAEKEKEREKEKEKERSEKAEKEAKAAAAAAAAAATATRVPAITVTAPSTGSTPTPSTTTGSVAPNNFFAMSAKPSQPSGTPAPPAPPPATTTARASTASTTNTAMPNFFAKPAEPVLPKTATAGSTGGGTFAFGVTQPPSAAGAGAGTAPATTTAATGTTPTPTGFSFGNPPGASGTAGMTMTTTTTTPTSTATAFPSALSSGPSASGPAATPPSLLSRVGPPAPAVAATGTSEQQQQQAKPLFTFPKPGATPSTAPMATSMFPPTNSAPATAMTVGSGSGSTTTPPPKFAFNFKPAAAGSSIAPASMTPTTAATGTSVTPVAEKKGPTSTTTPTGGNGMFAFKSPPAPGTGTASGTGSGGATASGPFSFGSTSAFGAGRETAPKSVFGNNNTGSAFGAVKDTPAKSVLAGTTTGSGTGSSGSVFGGTPTGSSAFGMTGKEGAPASGTGTATKSVFGATGTRSAFGSTGGTTGLAFGNTTTTTTSAFGKPSLGVLPSTSSSSSNPFGTTTAPTQMTTAATGSSSPFAQSPFNLANANANKASSNPFGVTATTGKFAENRTPTFSFGVTPPAGTTATSASGSSTTPATGGGGLFSFKAPPAPGSSPFGGGVSTTGTTTTTQGGTPGASGGVFDFSATGGQQK